MALLVGALRGVAREAPGGLRRGEEREPVGTRGPVPPEGPVLERAEECARALDLPVRERAGREVLGGAARSEGQGGAELAQGLLLVPRRETDLAEVVVEGGAIGRVDGDLH